MTRPRPSGWRRSIWRQCSRRALAADDEHGRTRGLVVQADGLRWDELYALAQVTASTLDWERRSGPGTWHLDCAVCMAISAHRRTTNRRRYRPVAPTTPRSRCLGLRRSREPGTSDGPAGSPAGRRGAGGTVRTPFKRHHHRRPPLSRNHKAVNRAHAKIRGINAPLPRSASAPDRRFAECVGPGALPSICAPGDSLAVSRKTIDDQQGRYWEVA